MAFLYRVYAYAIIVHTRTDQLLLQHLMEQFDTFPIQCRLKSNQPNRVFVYALMVPSWVDQLLPQILMEQFDTLPIQYRHTEHRHEVV